MTNGLKFSIATPRDIAQVHILETQLFTDPWPINSLMVCAIQGYQFIVGYMPEYPTRIVAYAVIDPGTGRDCGLAKIGVATVHQNVGLGRQILERVITQCRAFGYRSINLRVRVSNEVAIGLYQSAGFQKCNTIPSYYESPDEDAFILLKKFMKF